MVPTSLPELFKPSRTMGNLQKSKFLGFKILRKNSGKTTYFLIFLFSWFWPGFLALDQNGDGTDGRDGRDGRMGGRTGRTDGRTDGTDGRADGRDGRTEYSFTVLLGRRNTVLQYHLQNWRNKKSGKILIILINPFKKKSRKKTYYPHYLDSLLITKL